MKMTNRRSVIKRAKIARANRARISPLLRTSNYAAPRTFEDVLAEMGLMKFSVNKKKWLNPPRQSLERTPDKR